MCVYSFLNISLSLVHSLELEHIQCPKWRIDTLVLTKILYRVSVHFLHLEPRMNVMLYMQCIMSQLKEPN